MEDLIQREELPEPDALYTINLPDELQDKKPITVIHYFRREGLSEYKHPLLQLALGFETKDSVNLNGKRRSVKRVEQFEARKDHGPFESGFSGLTSDILVSKNYSICWFLAGFHGKEGFLSHATPIRDVDGSAQAVMDFVSRIIFDVRGSVDPRSYDPVFFGGGAPTNMRNRIGNYITTIGAVEKTCGLYDVPMQVITGPKEVYLGSGANVAIDPLTRTILIVKDKGPYDCTRPYTVAEAKQAIRVHTGNDLGDGVILKTQPKPKPV